MEERVRELENGINALMEQIDYSRYLIEQDSADEGGCMNPYRYGQLKVYKEIYDSLVEILEGEE